MSDSNIFNEFSIFMDMINKNKLLDTKPSSFIDSPTLGLVEKKDILTKTDSEETGIKKTIKSTKSRCSICKIKINPVDILISTCKCEKLHCLKHRMPESHSCSKMSVIADEQKKQLEKNLVKLDSKFTQEKI